MIKSKYKAILFDVDGVIIDSINYYSALLKKIAERLGADNSIEESFYKRHLGIKFDKWINKIIPENSHSKFKEEFILQENKLIDSGLINLLPGVIRLLSLLKKNEIYVGFITTKPRISLNKTISNFQLGKYINYTISGDEVKCFKPDPEGINKCLEYFRILKNEALFIGDTKHDCDASKNAGVDFIGVNTGVYDALNWNELDIKCVNTLNEIIEEIFLTTAST